MIDLGFKRNTRATRRSAALMVEILDRLEVIGVMETAEFEGILNQSSSGCRKYRFKLIALGVIQCQRRGMFFDMYVSGSPERRAEIKGAFRQHAGLVESRPSPRVIKPRAVFPGVHICQDEMFGNERHRMQHMSPTTIPPRWELLSLFYGPTGNNLKK